MVEFLDKALLAVTSLETSTYLVMAGTVLEVVFRILPTEKPLSVLHVVSRSVRLVSDLLEKVANLLDKVLPQVKKPAA